MEARAAPGTCIECGNDAFIRLTPAEGREDMICGACYAARHPQPVAKDVTSTAGDRSPSLPSAPR